MRISCLEMEKERRGKERQSAVKRVKEISARFREIEAEKKTATPLTQENELTKKYKLAGLKKEEKT